MGSRYTHTLASSISNRKGRQTYLRTVGRNMQKGELMIGSVSKGGKDTERASRRRERRKSSEERENWQRLVIQFIVWMSWFKQVHLCQRTAATWWGPIMVPSFVNQLLTFPKTLESLETINSCQFLGNQECCQYHTGPAQSLQHYQVESAWKRKFWTRASGEWIDYPALVFQHYPPGNLGAGGVAY